MPCVAPACFGALWGAHSTQQLPFGHPQRLSQSSAMSRLPLACHSPHPHPSLPPPRPPPTCTAVTRPPASAAAAALGPPPPMARCMPSMSVTAMGRTSTCAPDRGARHEGPNTSH
jgi:hypothetical protein